MKFAFTLSCKLVSLTNAREHWRKRAERAKAQRLAAKIEAIVHLTHGGHLLGRGSWVVTITRLGKRKLDDDNLASSAKHVRDGIADALGIDDGDERLRWRYRQETPKPYGVRVEMVGGDDGKHP